MKQYLYETHLHTSPVSRCAAVTAAEQVRHYAALGYTGICITDHFLNGNTTIPTDLPYPDRIACFCRGYEEARQEGERLGLDVLFGWEYTWPSGTDFLTYGLSPDWLLLHPELEQLSLPDYLDLVRSEGGIIIHAHPFREAGYIDMIRLLPRKIDGVEIDNACRTEFENEMAKRFAEAYGLAPAAGSDNHRGKLARYAGVASDVRFADSGELARAIVARRVELFSRTD